MFRNFQEHFERSGESRFGNDFRAFNSKYDRIKLILAAILIPVGCSIFYFLLSGHKYTELETAIANIEITQAPVPHWQMPDENQTASSGKNANVAAIRTSLNTPALNTPALNTPALNTPAQLTMDENGQNVAGLEETDQKETGAKEIDPNEVALIDNDLNDQNPQPSTDIGDTGKSKKAVSPVTTRIHDPATHDIFVDNQVTGETAVTELVPGRSLAELTAFLITDIASGATADSEDAASIAGRGQAELALLVDTKDKRGHLFSGSAMFMDSSVSWTGLNTTSNLDAGESEAVNILMIADDVNSQRSPIPAYTNVEQNPGPDTVINKSNVSKGITNLQLDREQARIVTVDKIIGLLKSEVIGTNATADAGKYKQSTNRHSRPAKKTYNVNKLESILEDI